MPYTKNIIILFVLCACGNISAQVYKDYLGNGHSVGVKVTSSSNQPNDTSTYTIIGSNIIPDTLGAARCLSQATLGADYEEIISVTNNGIHNWIDEQISLPYTSYYNVYRSIYDSITYKMSLVGDGSLVDSSRRRDYMDYAFYQKLFTEDDALRQRMALALSQILVVSMNNSQFSQRGFALSSYYDVLYEGAFGNFRDLIYNVTMHPAMGVYLSHFHNKKTDLVKGTFPDENYAREIMQLFSIGLLELNIDGSIKKDANENTFPTYTIEDVQELAKVFTGLSGGAYDLLKKPELTGQALKFGRGFNNYDLTVPMIMFDEQHEPGIKVMCTGDTIPAGQTGMQDINQAIDILFNHPNVGPFIGKRLIQHLVKSNPTPAYIKRVATAFNDNGNGVRGDLGAVLKAILLDPEALECGTEIDSTGGKLIQPIERFTNLFLGFNIDSDSGKFWWREFSQLFPKLEQGFYGSPTVFNFFTPFYAEDKVVSPAELVSPEFQILHSTSSIHYINLIENAIKIRPFRNRTKINPVTAKLENDNDDDPYLDLSDEIALYSSQGINAVLDRIDIILCRGQMDPAIKVIIADAITQFDANSGSYDANDAVNDALYFTMMSPNYMIQK